MAEPRPSIFITNDDGIHAPGLKALIEALQEDYQLTVIAPDQERSGFGSAITLHRHLRFLKISDGTYTLDGTPGDCVHLGLRLLMNDQKPDLMISGINRGPNLGDDTLFSGTVGAANVASLDGIPAIAVSMGDFREPMFYDTAAEMIKRLIKMPKVRGQLLGRVLNINVPNLPFGEIKGVRETRLGKRFYPRHYDLHEQDETLVKYGRGDVTHDELPDSDVTAIEQQMVSLTLLRPHLLDVKAYEARDNSWVPGFDELLDHPPS